MSLKTAVKPAHRTRLEWANLGRSDNILPTAQMGDHFGHSSRLKNPSNGHQNNTRRKQT
jgi:hypothetical protein